jgi:ribonuclease P protein component
VKTVTLKFTKQQRLTKAYEFSQVFENNQHKANSNHLLLLAMTTQLPLPRLGLVISKKNVGCAVARNRVKRLSREVFRQRCDLLPPSDLIVLAKPGISGLSNQKLIALLHQMFDKLQQSFPRSSSQPSRS